MTSICKKSEDIIEALFVGGSDGGLCTFATTKGHNLEDKRIRTWDVMSGKTASWFNVDTFHNGRIKHNKILIHSWHVIMSFMELHNKSWQLIWIG